MFITQTMVIGEKRYEPLYLCNKKWVWSADKNHALYMTKQEANQVLDQILNSFVAKNPAFEYDMRR